MAWHWSLVQVCQFKLCDNLAIFISKTLFFFLNSIFLTLPGSGIGREVALTLASRGASVLICADINIEAAQQTAEIGQSRKAVADFHATAIQVDVRQERDVERLLAEAKARFGRVDVCVNTAGVSRRHLRARYSQNG